MAQLEATRYANGVGGGSSSQSQHEMEAVAAQAAAELEREVALAEADVEAAVALCPDAAVCVRWTSEMKLRRCRQQQQQALAPAAGVAEEKTGDDDSTPLSTHDASFVDAKIFARSKSSEKLLRYCQSFLAVSQSVLGTTDL